MAGKPLGLAGADFAKAFGKLSTAVERGKLDTVKAAALEAKKAHAAVIRKDSGGDDRLSGVNRAKGRKGNVKVGVRFDIKGSSGGTTTAEIKATGPLQIIANPTRARRIASAYSGGSRAKRSLAVGPILPSANRGGRRAVLNIPGIGYRRSVRHKGTTGKDTWNIGARRAAPKIDKAMNAETANIIKRGFG